MIYDQKRTKYLSSPGIKVIRFFNYEILENMDGVWIVIEDEIKK